MSPPALTQALSGCVVLDFSQAVAGPYASALLADLGARVIKVEPPGGELARTFGTVFGHSGITFKYLNRNKEFIVLDLKTPHGRAAAHRLVAQADVLVENNRPGVGEKLGLGVEDLQTLNPRLIHLSITAFGQEGPNARRGGTDSIIQAYSGLAAEMGEKGRPLRLKLSIIDLVTGLFASHAVVAALLARQTSRAGCFLPVSLLHAAVALQNYKIGEAVGNPDRRADLFPANGLFPTTDGFLMLSASHDRHVIGTLKVVGRLDLLDEERFADTAARIRHQEELNGAIAAALLHKPARVWREAMLAEDLLAEEVTDYQQVLADPHVAATGLFHMRDFASLASPLPFTPLPGAPHAEVVARDVPAPGADTRRILDEFAIDVT